MRQALVLIHDYGDTLGNLTGGLLDQRFVCSYWNPVLQFSPPRPAETWDLLIVLGGAAHPGPSGTRHWQQREIGFLEQAIAQDVPVLAICLGAQLIAMMLGASPRPLTQPEIGPFPVRPAGPDGALEALEASRFHVFQWHQYGFECPPGATPLAFGPDGMCAAFGFRNRVLATQFHIEATREIFEGWMLENLPHVEGRLRTLHDEVRDLGPSIERACRTVFSDWLARVVCGQATYNSSRGETGHEIASP